MLDFGEPGISRQAREEPLDGRLQSGGCDQQDEQTSGGDGERDVCDEVKMRRGDTANGRDEHQNEDKDVEKFFEDDGAENCGGRGAEVASVGEDAHNVADAQGKDVVGGERGHQDASADEKVCAEGARTAGHHLAPANAAQGVAGDGEAEDAEDPDRMRRAQSEDMSEGDSAEGIPEKEGADEQTGDCLQ